MFMNKNYLICLIIGHQPDCARWTLPCQGKPKIFSTCVNCSKDIYTSWCKETNWLIADPEMIISE